MKDEIKEEIIEEFENKFVELAPDGSNWGVGLRIKHTGTIEDRKTLESIKGFILSALSHHEKAAREEIIAFLKKENENKWSDAIHCTCLGAAIEELEGKKELK